VLPVCLPCLLLCQHDCESCHGSIMPQINKELLHARLAYFALFVQVTKSHTL
jgi:hypothetical protein